MDNIWHSFFCSNDHKFCCVIGRANIFLNYFILLSQERISPNSSCRANRSIVARLYHFQSPYCALAFSELVTRMSCIEDDFALIICLRMREYSAYFISYMFFFLDDCMVERKDVWTSDDEMLSVLFESLPGLIHRTSVRIWDGDDSYTIMLNNWCDDFRICWYEYRCWIGEYLAASLISVAAGRSESKNW